MKRLIAIAVLALALAGAASACEGSNPLCDDRGNCTSPGSRGSLG